MRLGERTGATLSTLIEIEEPMFEIIRQNEEKNKTGNHLMSSVSRPISRIHNSLWTAVYVKLRFYEARTEYKTRLQERDRFFPFLF